MDRAEEGEAGVKNYEHQTERADPLPAGVENKAETPRVFLKITLLLQYAV